MNELEREVARIANQIIDERLRELLDTLDEWKMLSPGTQQALLGLFKTCGIDVQEPDA